MPGSLFSRGLLKPKDHLLLLMGDLARQHRKSGDDITALYYERMVLMRRKELRQRNLANDALDVMALAINGVRFGVRLTQIVVGSVAEHAVEKTSLRLHQLRKRLP